MRTTTLVEIFPLKEMEALTLFKLPGVSTCLQSNVFFLDSWFLTVFKAVIVGVVMCFSAESSMCPTGWS